MNNTVVNAQQWLEARKELLAKEKQFTRLRDELSEQRRALPWIKVDKQYIFEGESGKQLLADLFEDRSQLIIYHFMYGTAWQEGCPSCSFWADNYNNIIVHLNQRDISFATISFGPLTELLKYKKRMQWSFNWLSSSATDFNQDFQVSFLAEDLKKQEVYYNYQTTNFPSSEAPGISVFYKDDAGDIFHSYSCYSRGLDMLNGAYNYMDLVPKGRDEAELSFSMGWLKRHDKY